MLGAFPWDKTPQFLIRDRDGCYEDRFRQAVREMNIREVLTATDSPWQNGYVERLIGSLRRECLDQVIVLNEASSYRILRAYSCYHERTRAHLALGKDAPEPRTAQLPESGTVVELPQVGGLPHRYEQREAVSCAILTEWRALKHAVQRQRSPCLCSRSTTGRN